MPFFSPEADEADAPWPERGDRLFRQGSHWGATAQLDGLESEGSGVVAEGYLRAADLLATAWLNGEAGRPLSVCAAAVSLPIIAHYRHGLEMTMKALLSDYSELTEAEIARFGHSLAGLWTASRKIIWPYDEEPGEDLLGVETAVMDFHAFDPSNEKLRYAYDRRGSAIVLRSVDIAHLRDRMRAVANFFDCADTELHVRAFGF